MRILFLDCGGICYVSTLYFIEKIKHEFERLGNECVHVSLPKENPQPRLEKLVGEAFDIVMDINTPVPFLKDEKGEYLLNKISGSKWHYIVDHPLYHHDTLIHPINDFNVICVDENHAKYLREFYPNVNRAVTLSLCGETVKNYTEFGKRKNDLLFAGTYTPPEEILIKNKRRSPILQQLFKNLLDILMENPGMTQERALEIILRDMGQEEIINEKSAFTKLLSDCYLADHYLQAVLREEMLYQAVLSGKRLTLFGHKWELFKGKISEKNPKLSDKIEINGPVPYQSIPEIYNASKIILNQTPWFKAGMHDRVPMAMAAGAVPLTEANDYTKKLLGNGGALYYDIEDMSQIPDIINEFLNEPEAASEMSLKAYEFAKNNLGYERWVSSFNSVRV